MRQVQERCQKRNGEKTMKESYKLNTLELAKHHRKNCEGEDCNISLNVLRMMAEECGVKFTDKEKEEFT